MQKQTASVTNWLLVQQSAAEELGPEDVGERLRVNGGLVGNGFERKILLDCIPHERALSSLSLE